MVVIVVVGGRYGGVRRSTKVRVIFRFRDRGCCRARNQASHSRLTWLAEVKLELADAAQLVAVSKLLLEGLYDRVVPAKYVVFRA